MVLNDATDLRIGTTGVTRVYLGSTLVWPSVTPPTPTGYTATLVTSLSDIDTASTYMLALSYSGTDYYLTDTETPQKEYCTLGTGITISSNSINNIPSNAFLFNLRNGYKMVSGNTYMKLYSFCLIGADSQSDATVFDVVSTIDGYSLSYGYTLANGDGSQYTTECPIFNNRYLFWNTVDTEGTIFRLYKID